MDNNELIKKLWQRFHELTRRQENMGAYMNIHLLPQCFDQDVLNDIASLRILKSDDTIAERVDSIRGQFRIAASTGLIGDKDLEELDTVLDAINREK